MKGRCEWGRRCRHTNEIAGNGANAIVKKQLGKWGRRGGMGRSQGRSGSEEGQHAKKW